MWFSRLNQVVKQAGKQRYKCKNCGILFTGSNRAVTQANRFVWFEKWVVGKGTLDQLVMESGQSKSTIQWHFKSYLKEPPILGVYPSRRVNLLIDGTYFTRDLCLILYRDNSIKFTQLYRFSDAERYQELKENLENLLILGVQIESITCDGHRALLRAIRRVCPEVTLRRCVIHVERMFKIWLSGKPKSIPGLELRTIVSTIHLVQTKQQLSHWLLELANWDTRHHQFVEEKTINPIFSVLKCVLPHLFSYLDNPRIPKSTHGRESFFGHLKTDLNVHRGLSNLNRKSLLRWYLYFRNAGRKRFS